MTDAQVLLNESVARVSANDFVNQGDQADNAIKDMAIHIPNDNFPCMIWLLLPEGRSGELNRSCVLSSILLLAKGEL